METANTGGGNPSSTIEAPAQTEYKPPEGKVLLDAAEAQVLRQNNERVRGMQGYYEAGSKYGLKKPEDFESVGKWRSFEKSLKDKGLTTEQIMAAFESQETEQQAPQTPQLDRATIEKILGGKIVTADELESREKRNSAISEREKLTASEKQLMDKYLADTLGENPSTRDRFLMQNALRALMEEKRQLYPEGHPLHSEFLAPFDEKSATALFDEFKKQIAVSEGSDMAALGKEAAKSKPVPTPAGNRAGQGKADDNPSSTPKSQLRAAIERQHATRGKG
jgi:hypothetical protein